MVEVKLGPYARSLGYDPFHVTLEVYRLFSCVAASETLARKVASDVDNRHVWEELKKSEFSEVCRILIGLAAAARNSLDAGYNTELESTVVGELVPNVNEPQTKVPLTFRIGCHKVLHAHTVQPDVVIVDGTQPSMSLPLTNHIHLRGEHREEKWHAVVDLYRFAATAYGVC